MSAPQTSATRRSFGERLGRAPLLLDGAMGTLLFSRGVPQRSRSTSWSIAAGADRHDPSRVHRRRCRRDRDQHLRCQPPAPGAVRSGPARPAALNRRAAQLAREARDVAGRRDVLVARLASGRSKRRFTARSGRHDADIRAAFREQIEGLLEGGVDLLLFETFSELAELLARHRRSALAGRPADHRADDLRRRPDARSTARSPQTAATALAAAGVDAVGVNCGVGPLICLDALAQMGRPSPGLARSIVPNAGLPQRIEGQFVYAAGPAYFGAEVARFLDAGARIIGGCCGTTPEHIRHMRARARRSSSGTATAAAIAEAPGAVWPARVRRSSSVRAASRRPSRRRPPAWPTLLAERRFVVSVEIDPPRSVRIERTIEAGQLLQEAGVDVVNISDSAMARVRMGAMAVAFGIQHDLDLECIVHVTTRDRNLMALESELLGAHALGVRNILALTGDPPRIGDYPAGTGIWDVDSVGLVGHPGAPQPRRGPGRQADRRAGRLHHRLRRRPDRRRPRSRDRAPWPPRSRPARTWS